MKAEIYLRQGWCWSAEPHRTHADLHGLPGHPGRMFSCVSLLGRQAQEDHLDLTATGKFPLSLFTSSPSILLLQHRGHHIQKSCAARAGLCLLGEPHPYLLGGVQLFVETPERRSRGLHKQETCRSSLAHTPVPSLRPFLLHLASIPSQSCPVWPWTLGYVSGFMAWKKVCSVSWRGTLQE